jgi:hypothetical protein
MRRIAVDEEITFDYAMCLHQGQGLPRYRMICACGRRKCRGVITDDDWKMVAIQRRYRGWFQPFLEEAIRARGARRQMSAPQSRSPKPIKH